jgi:hypothetical protein
MLRTVHIVCSLTTGIIDKPAACRAQWHGGQQGPAAVQMYVNENENR